MADNQQNAPSDSSNTIGMTDSSNTTGMAESSNTKDKEIAELQAKLEALQKAANQQVPASVFGETAKRDHIDPESAALDLDWGDFDPAFLNTLNHNKTVRDSFIAAQTLAADST